MNSEANVELLAAKIARLKKELGLSPESSFNRESLVC